MKEADDKMRIDKWLWCVRIFKTRTQATDAARSGHIKVNEKAAKASQMVVPNDLIHLKKDGFNLIYQVTALIPSRVGAPIAQTCYINLTPEAEMKKFDEWYVGKAKGEFREKGAGRPTKRDRRIIGKFKERD
ncbi:MAG: RNA-binding S4 domain-containing protein [Saprospiraceae bacterium]|nr:RNA-binding S4 domain-containing protein [Saprospiraceae bacterium]